MRPCRAADRQHEVAAALALVRAEGLEPSPDLELFVAVTAGELPADELRGRVVARYRVSAADADPHQLVHDAGHHIDWIGMDPAQNTAARMVAHHGDLAPLQVMLEDLIDPPPRRPRFSFRPEHWWPHLATAEPSTLCPSYSDLAVSMSLAGPAQCDP